MKRIPFDPRRAVDWAAGHLNAEFIPDPVLAPFYFLFYILHKSEKNKTNMRDQLQLAQPEKEKRVFVLKAKRKAEFAGTRFNPQPRRNASKCGLNHVELISPMLRK